MALVVKDRVRETSTTGGTGTLTLGGVVNGFQSFSVIGDGNTTYYGIADAATGSFEVGLGTYSSSGTTLSRDVVLESSNSGSLVNFSTNVKDVFCTYPAEKAVYANASDVVDVTTLSATTVEVTNIKAKDGTAAGSIANSTGVVTLASSVLTTADINGGTIDGTVIGGATAAAGTFTTATATTGNITTVNATTVDATNVEVTNVKAKDGTAAVQIADSTGVVSVTAAPVLTALTASQAVFTNASKALVSNAITGSGNVVMSTSPTLVTPVLGTPSSGTVTNLTGTASININGTVGATTPATGSFTTLNTSGQVVFNDAGANVDFRVEGDTDANLLFVDASTDRVGIGTSSPDTLLHLSSSVGNAVIRLERNDTTITTNDVYGSIEFEGQDATTSSSGVRGSITGLSDGTGGNMSLVFSTAPFIGSNTERMRIDSAGKVGIGTTAPDVKLDVVGQVRASTGILFGSDTAAANALDDYEEGTWTPVLSDASTGGNTSPTAATSAIYTKVGRLVTVQGFFANIATTGMTAGNDMFIQGLPFTAASVAGTTFVPGSIILADVTFTGQVAPYVTDNRTFMEIRESASGVGTDPLMVSEFATGAADIWFNLTYQAA